MKNEIEKQIDVKAPLSRVWRALTDYREFGRWFQVRLDGPFVPGQACAGAMTYPGFEGKPFTVMVKEIQPERLFSYTWHPYALDPDRDYDAEPQTLVVFTLQEIAGGTRLTVNESGFDSLAADRREEAFSMNEGGWEAQLQNVARHVAQ
ncbi:MAG: SRPBCC family protein [Pseudomonadota bacterium]